LYCELISVCGQFIFVNFLTIWKSAKPNILSKHIYVLDNEFSTHLSAMKYVNLKKSSKKIIHKIWKHEILCQTKKVEFTDWLTWIGFNGHCYSCRNGDEGNQCTRL